LQFSLQAASPETSGYILEDVEMQFEYVIIGREQLEDVGEQC
jgi:hypothetical protein